MTDEMLEIMAWSRGKHVFSCMNNRLMLKMTISFDSH